MRLIRIIPNLLVNNKKLIKGKNFTNHQYVGDIFNTIKLFTEKKAHEILLLDKSHERDEFFIFKNLLEKFATECFVPITVGGGIRDINDVSRIINSGVEKICLPSSSLLKKNFINSIAKKFGSQSIMISIDLRIIDNKYRIFNKNGSNLSNLNYINLIKELENEGCGEILLTSIDREGTKTGYDIDLYKSVEDIVKIPIIANGGVGKNEHFDELFSSTNLSAASAGSQFVFFGKRNAVLINYPDEDYLLNLQSKYEIN